MKKILSILLILALLVTGVGAAMPADAGLPAVGELVEGFVVRETRDFPLVGGTAILFEHERTGARLMYIANNDTNRVFDLTFFTRAIDNTGLPHVFEHATLNGSEKYPSTALFFNLSFQTYNTFMNAMTYPLMTTYPVASLSEEQLLKYADFYTDSCLHPSILEDESIYREEAWRYRMASMEDELTIEGTVYSEMLGAMDLDNVAYLNMLRAAFPGSTIGNESGGDPAYIPDMTWEALKEYHETFYHPSNCIAYLYGDFEDYTAFLKLLDEAFAPYEKREFSFEDPAYTPISEPVEQCLAFPVEAGAATEDRSTVYYAFICPGLKDDAEEELVLNTLTDLLIADASPLMQSLKKALPSGSFASYIETEGPEDAILFVAQNVDPEDAETFRDTVNAVLADVAEKGFAQDLVDGVMASLSLSIKLTSESSDVGVNLIPSLAYDYSSGGDPFGYMDYVDALASMDDWNQQGLYAKAVSGWLLESRTAALVTTYPEPGLREELDEAEAARLAEQPRVRRRVRVRRDVDGGHQPHEGPPRGAPRARDAHPRGRHGPAPLRRPRQRAARPHRLRRDPRRAPHGNRSPGQLRPHRPERPPRERGRAVRDGHRRERLLLHPAGGPAEGARLRARLHGHAHPAQVPHGAAAGRAGAHAHAQEPPRRGEPQRRRAGAPERHGSVPPARRHGLPRGRSRDAAA